MQTWHVDAQPAGGSLPLASVALLLEAAVATRPAEGWLRFVREIAPVDYLSVVEYVRPAGGAAVPELVEGLAAPDIPNVTPECFAVYRERFWRSDEATRLAQHARAPLQPVTALRFTPADITVASWRREIYDRVKLVDRLSFLYAPAAGMTFAMNMYRAQRHGPFCPHDIERLLQVAPLIQLAHRAALRSRLRAEDDLGERLLRAERGVRRHVPDLSEREHAVCARIACGISIDGIAADLDIAPSSVATLRKRAYAKLARRGITPGRAQLARIAE